MDYAYLKEQYVDLNKSTHQIAKENGTYPQNVARLLKKYGIPTRSKSEAQSAYLTSTENHPTKGKKRDETTKRKVGQSMVNFWENMDETEKTRISDLAKKRWEDMTDEEKYSIHKKGIRKIKETSKKGSKLENFIYKYLAGKGVQVEFHKNMLTNQKLEVDMYLPEYKTVIEVDGPSHFKPIWGEKALAKQQKADADKYGLIIRSGYHLVRLKHDKTTSPTRFTNAAENMFQQLKKFRFDKPTKVEIEV